MIVLIFAHPYPDRSRANRALLAAARRVPGVDVRSLYELYPSFDIDVAAEQAALAGADAIVLQHPMYWYSVPGLLKHWFDKVLTRGWAYGRDGVALRGKRCLWVTTTGADADEFSAQGMHGFALEAFVPAIEQTVRFCGMRWEPPIVIHGAHRIARSALDAEASAYRARVESLAASNQSEARP
jgi:glutathione-regulated potassium-efflux system ancillary protein KefF